MSFRIDVIANHGCSPQTLLTESRREGARVRHKTVANFTKLPLHVVDGFRAVLNSGAIFTNIDDAVSIRRSLAHGRVAAILGLARKLGLPRILDRKNTRHGELALAAIVARIIAPASKLATALQLSPLIASSSLGTILGLGEVTGNEMLAMLDSLDGRQRHIEGSLARRQLSGSALVLSDVSSIYVEGRRCPLFARGHNRDGEEGVAADHLRASLQHQGMSGGRRFPLRQHTGDPSPAWTARSPISRSASASNGSPSSGIGACLHPRGSARTCGPPDSTGPPR